MTPLQKFALVGILLGLMLFFFFPDERSVVTVITSDRGDFTFYVTIANTPEARAAGLQHVEALDFDRGMWFVYDEAQPLTYWMKDTLMPLDIVFVDSSGVIQTIYSNVPPCFDVDPEQVDCPTYSSEGLSRFVLEIGGGVAAAKGIQVGNTITF